jgi:uncharacterized protein YlxW (UPF0749 family)
MHGLPNMVSFHTRLGTYRAKTALDLYNRVSKIISLPSFLTLNGTVNLYLLSTQARFLLVQLHKQQARPQKQQEQLRKLQEQLRKQQVQLRKLQAQLRKLQVQLRKVQGQRREQRHKLQGLLQEQLHKP